MQHIKKDSMQAWWLAARPRTLTVCAAPVLVGLAAAWADVPRFEVVPAVLCLLFALLMQVDANFVNDYFDWARGVDTEERLGPERACSQGWITPSAMRLGIAVTTVLACLVGLPLTLWGGTDLILVGLCCVLFCFLYTTTLAGKGWGDALVVVFFGLIPTAVTYYIQAHQVPVRVALLALGCGLVADTLLLVNNYRDRDTDRSVGKITLAVRLGARRTEWLYLWVGLAGVLLCVPHFAGTGHPWALLLPALYLLPHIATWRELRRIRQGRALNATLGRSARNIFLFGVLLSIGLLI